MADGFARCSFTLPPDQVELLANVARRVGASQSAVLSVLLEDALPWVANGLGPDVGEDVGARRLRGASVEVVRGAVLGALGSARRAGVSGKVSGSVPVSRNALCPCGSGKKFKRCCGA